MDSATARLLAAETGEFYRRNSASFSATRHTAWAGWSRALSGFVPSEAASVLDLACGNLRFERYLEGRFADTAWRFHALDNCPPLVGASPQVAFQELDLVEALLAGNLEAAIAAPPCDIVACFGFLHHVPGHALRADLLRALAAKTAPGGMAIVSFWQFLNSPDLAARAREAHGAGLRALAARGLDAGQLEPGDYLLGWQGGQDAFRYCHAFAAGEVDILLADAGLAGRVRDRFEADGRTGNLNAYVVLE